jgi:pyruvate carboxylase
MEIEIDPGKIHIIELISIGDADNSGRCAMFYELNGMPRESIVADKSLQEVSKASCAKGEPNNPSHAGAPMPGIGHRSCGFHRPGSQSGR